MLNTPLNHHELSDPEAEILFEAMVKALPRNFNYAAFPNVNLFIGHLLLQSELKGRLLMKEIETLTGQITDKLARDPKEKEIVRLLKDYHLLQKLFALELTAEEFEKIVGRGTWDVGRGKQGASFRPTSYVLRLTSDRMDPSVRRDQHRRPCSGNQLHPPCGN